MEGRKDQYTVGVTAVHSVKIPSPRGKYAAKASVYVRVTCGHRKWNSAGLIEVHWKANWCIPPNQTFERVSILENKQQMPTRALQEGHGFSSPEEAWLVTGSSIMCLAHRDMLCGSAYALCCSFFIAYIMRWLWIATTRHLRSCYY